MATAINILYMLLKAFGLIEQLVEEHNKRKEAQDIANAPQTKSEEAAYWDSHK